MSEAGLLEPETVAKMYADCQNCTIPFPDCENPSE